MVEYAKYDIGAIQLMLGLIPDGAGIMVLYSFAFLSRVRS